MLTRPLVLTALLLLGLHIANAQNLRERQQNQQQIQTGKTVLVRDVAELQQLQDRLQQLNGARKANRTVEVQRLQNIIYQDLLREVQQGEAKVAAYQREVAQSQAEVRTEQREIRRNRRDSRRGWDRADDRRDMIRDRNDRRDDQRDVRDDQQDRASAIARVNRQRTIVQTINTPAAIGKRRNLIQEFLQLMQADITDTRRELNEDYAEQQEDRRETRDDIRERREWR